MTARGDADCGNVAEATGSPGDRLEALRAGGAGRFDPVRFTFIESMARRARECGEPLSRVLEARLQPELEALEADFTRAGAAAAALVTRAGERHPGALEQLRLLLDRGDFRGVQRLAARLDRAAGRVRVPAPADRVAPGSPGEAPGQEGSAGPVEECLWRQEQAALRSLAAAGASRQGFNGRPGGELRSVHRLRVSQGRHRADRLLAQAIREAPAECGPLNPQRLVIGTLSDMRDLSPEYLGRLVSYVDTLFWLESAAEDEA